ncbi:MAG: hypothetical protein E6I82_00685 [Chloroflexi bacterium]|nr:MAG: hypothetical protein E6I82_00685 [Chloroflexota bacterium]TMF08243.1 MAG: hypothetical protein E6I41_08550 [Chloroflexota bacterium]
MVKRFFRPLRGWPIVETFVLRLAGHFTTWPADDFGRFVSASVGTGMAGAFAAMPPPVEPLRPPPPTSAAPASFEMRFMKLHAEGRFDEMWELLAEDAQRAWGGLQNFIREMPRLDEWLEILDMEVTSTTVLESWTDHLHQRTYNNVARLVMRYRVRQQWKEWTFDRQVHLVPAAGGWRTLCYPTRARMATGH